MAKWMLAAKKADFDGIARKYHITPVLARIMRNRDVAWEEEIEKYLHGDLKDLYDPLLMKDMKKAADILLIKIREKKSIRIIGDYDVDGICATYILLSGIRALGGRVDTVIPHRIKDGYGLNENLIREAAQEGIDCIVTCDNGIAAAPQIRMAKESGMTVVVTDHHEVPFEEKGGERTYLLPEADAVVDPKQPGCAYPFKQICGAVVALKLVQVLMGLRGFREEKEGVPRSLPERESQGAPSGLPEREGQGVPSGLSEREGQDVLSDLPEREGQDMPMDLAKRYALMEELLAFAALATVCDVMELKDENRIVVKRGLKQIAVTGNLGLKALLAVNGIENKEPSPYHAGFIIGPCLNATGRLDAAKRALELFEAKSWREAVTIAGDLKSLNESRKQMTEEGLREAITQVEERGLARDRVLVIYLSDCHESLAGIIAGRVRELYGRPAFVLTKGEEGVKGSGRSIEAYHMYEEISACKELFTRYGGHRMAAGLSMAEEETVEVFRKRLNESCTLTEEDFQEIVHIDVPMPLSYVNREFIEELSLLEPFGAGNPKPLFARKQISLLSGRILGKNRNVGKYRIADETGQTYEMIYFGDLEQFHDFLSGRFGAKAEQRLYGEGACLSEMQISMAYYPELNCYGGRESIQFVMQHYC